MLAYRDDTQVKSGLMGGPDVHKILTLYNYWWAFMNAQLNKAINVTAC